MQEHVCVEKRCYPDTRAAAAAVRDIWKDCPVSTVTESAHEWCFRVCSGWPMTPFPDLTAEEIARAMFGLNPSQISAFHRTEVWPDGRLYSLSLSHAWSLWAWSNVLQGPTEPLTVIHLDAHADLEIPALGCSAAAGRFNAPVGSGYLDIGEPASVASCLEDGFIGIGGFIVPLIFANPNCHFVHVEPAGAKPRAPHQAYLRARRVAHHSLFGVQQRPAVTIENQGEQCYQQISNLDDVARLEPAGSVLLDIDMDYFCNPFEQKDEKAGKCVPQHCWEQVEVGIDRVTTLLERAAWRPRVRVVTVALSPGFFPSQYWAAALAKIEPSLRRTFS